MAWQFLNIFLQYAKPLAKSTESVYNAFIRMVVNLLPEIAYDTRSEAGGQALAELLYTGNFVTIDTITLDAGEAVIDFNSNYFPWVAGSKVVFIDYNPVSGYRFVKVVSISEAQWTARQVSIADAQILGASCAAYFVSADGSKMSNVLNVE